MSSPRPRPNYKWELLAILWMAYFLNMGDSQVYGAVLPLIKGDLRVNDVGLGLVSTVYLFCSAFSSPIAGCVGDFASKKWLVCLSVLTFSAATLFTGFSRHLSGLVLFRGALMGIGAAFYFPAGNALVGHYHRGTRGVAMAVHQSSSYLGIIISSWVAGWLGEAHGWRSAFYIFGLAGVLLAAVAAGRLREEAAPPHPVGSAGRSQRLGSLLRPVLRTPSFYCLSVAWGSGMITNWGFILWMPTFLYEKFHLSLKQAALYAVLYHFVGALCGVMVGGRISDLLAPRRKTIRMETKMIGWLLAVPFIWLMGSSASLTLVYVGLAGFGFFRGYCESNTFAALFDVIPAPSRSSATGLMISGGLCMSALSPMLLGYVKQHVNLGAGLSWLAFANLFAALVMFGGIKLFFARDYVGDPPPAPDTALGSSLPTGIGAQPR